MSASRDDFQLHNAKIDALREVIGAIPLGIARRQALAVDEETNSEALTLVPKLMTPGIDACSFGFSEIDNCLPAGGLKREAVHEVLGTCFSSSVAASGFLLSLLKVLSGGRVQENVRPILWCQTAKSQNELGNLYGPALERLGRSADEFLLIEGCKPRDVLWALEEGARAGCLGGVVGAVEGATFTQTRRLALAAEAGQTPVLLLRPHDDLSTSAAQTRWRVRSASSTGTSSDAFPCEAEARRTASTRAGVSVPGDSRWQVELNRIRGGRSGRWLLEWCHETYCFRLAGAVRSGPSGVAKAPDATGARDGKYMDWQIVPLQVASG